MEGGFIRDGSRAQTCVQEGSGRKANSSTRDRKKTNKGKGRNIYSAKHIRKQLEAAKNSKVKSHKGPKSKVNKKGGFIRAGSRTQTCVQEGGYSKITNPETGRKVNIFGKIGIRVIKNYLNQLGGHEGPCAIGSKGRCAKSDAPDGNCELSPKGRCRKIKSKSASKAKVKKMVKRGKTVHPKKLKETGVKPQVRTIKREQNAQFEQELSRRARMYNMSRSEESGSARPSNPNLLCEGGKCVVAPRRERLVTEVTTTRDLGGNIKTQDCEMYKTRKDGSRRLSARCYYDTYGDESLGDKCDGSFGGKPGCLRLVGKKNTPKWQKCKDTDSQSSCRE